MSDERSAIRTSGGAASLRSRLPPPGALLMIVGVVALDAWIALPQVESGTPDVAALMMSTPDEYEIGAGIHRMITERTLDYRIPEYPGFYPVVGFVVAKQATKWLAGSSERMVVLSLRWLSFAFALATIFAVIWLARIVTGRWSAGAIAGVVVGLSPEFLYWAVRIHPDTLLLFVLTIAQIALVEALRNSSRGWVVVSLIFLALATMTKLVGLFLVPWVILADLYLELRTRPGPSQARFLRRLAIGALIFAAVALMTTPRLLVDLSGFLRSIGVQMQDNAGARADSKHPPLGWISVLGSNELVGPVALLVFVAWSVLTGRALLRKVDGKPGWRNLDDPRVLGASVAAFAWGLLGYLALTTRLYETRYAMPALPSIACGVGAILSALFSKLAKKRSEGSARLVMALAAVLAITALFVTELPGRWKAVDASRRWMAKQATDPRLEVGAWLKRHAERESRIFYDYNVYVPLEFKRARLTYGLLRSEVAIFRPHFVLIHAARRVMFKDAPDAFGNERERLLHKERVETLRELESGRLFGLREVARFDAASIVVYQDLTASECEPACAWVR